MPVTDPALAQLADLYGISTEFWDWKGRRTDVDDATVVAVLRAFDCDASTSERAHEAVAAFGRRRWQRALPPCVVMRANAVSQVPVHVPAGADAHLYIKLEHGGTADARHIDNQVPDQQIDDQWLGEATFEIPAGLPLGYHRLTLVTGGRELESTLIVTPPWLGFPPGIGDRRLWGYATQLYSVTSTDSWGTGDLTDLSDLGVWSATQQYADYVLINPLHAAEAVSPMEPSPYLPSSRRYINPLYLRPEAIDEFATLSATDRRKIANAQRKLAGATAAAEHVQRDASWKAKRAALEIIFRAGRKATRQMAFEDFARREGRQLRDFATWCALSEQYGPQWQQWPEELQRPTSPSVDEFADDHSEVIDFYCWLQWVADTQLSSAQQTMCDAGMSIGVISDLAVGVNAHGAETWALASVFAQGVTVGAPPDPYNQSGQDWGQPPWRPDRLADLAYAPFRAMVAGILRHSGGVRVDHIIGLFRLWWIPEGHGPQQGAYVRYDHEALVGILALEAHRAQALVVGEDLGTVEPWVRTYLRERGILGTSILWFENDEAGAPLAASQWREYCMASVTTHDLPPTAGYLKHDHVELRYRLGLLTESLDSEIEADAREQASVIAMLTDQGALAAGDHDTDDVVTALYRFLTWTPARMLCVALTDAVGERRAQNQPGTINEYPNWRVPLAGPDGRRLLLNDLYVSERAMRLSAVMNGFTTVPEVRRDWGDEPVAD